MEILKQYGIKLCFLLCSCVIFAQSNTADKIYNRLDIYLERPNINHQKALKQLLSDTQTVDKPVLLAKTVAYCNLGYIAKQNNDFTEAIKDYEQAKQLYFEHNLKRYDIVEYALKPLGNLYIKTQAFAEAESVIKQYILIAKEGRNQKQETAGLLNLSVLYYSRGDFQKVVKILKPIWQKDTSNKEVELNLASAYFALGEIKKAKVLLHDIFKAHQVSIKANRLLAEIYLKEENYREAINLLEATLTLQEEREHISIRERAKLHLDLAETYWLANNKELAKQQIQAVYANLIPFYKAEKQECPKENQLYAETVLMDALDLQAAILKDSDRPVEAFNLYQKAKAVNNSLFLNVYAQESKLRLQQEEKLRFDKMLHIAYDEYIKTKTSSWLKKALQIDREAKARVVSEASFFKDLLSKKHTEKYIKLQQLQQQSAALINQIQDHIHNNDFDVREMTAFQNRYSEIVTKQQLLYQNLTKNSRGVKDFSNANLLSQLKHKADSLNLTLVSYFFGQQSLYQFVVDADSIQFKKLNTSSESLDKQIQLIRQYIAFFETPQAINSDISEFSKTAYNLYRKLELPQVENLIIIPDGLLTFVSFQALLYEESETHNYQKMPFLIRHTSISYLLNLNGFLKPSKHFEPPQKVLGFFPVFKNTDRELTFSIEEAEAIEKQFPAELLMNKNASRINFLSKSGEGTILHISTHALAGGFYQEASVLFSDKALKLNELYAMHISPDLAVLSACETGIGKLSKGEGALSLARGFQYAGAQNVLMSLWEVNDKSTALWMSKFYKHLKTSYSRNQAVTQADLAYLEASEIDNTRKSPYYWAAFNYYGTVDAPKENSSFIYYVAVLGVLVLIVMALILWRRRS